MFLRKMTPCKQCNAECCRYVSVNLDNPTDKADWDEMRWLLMHDNITIHKNHDNEWVVEFRTKCKNLEDNKCKIYDKRPDICKEHDTDECDITPGEFGDVFFRKPEDVDEFLKKK